MCLTLGEVPDIAFVQHLDLVAAVLVHGADGDLTVVDVAPLGNAVPVHLADAVFRQVLLGARDVVSLGDHDVDLESITLGFQFAFPTLLRQPEGQPPGLGLSHGADEV